LRHEEKKNHRKGKESERLWNARRKRSAGEEFPSMGFSDVRNKHLTIGIFHDNDGSWNLMKIKNG